ncbi:hypothetical protein ASG01_09520 [Chryseobacterium sp. Leaf180]|uniref:bestrophin family protein n=1 Tax=Chryseobacterium sp. Leaf180 TaxID=1736289 RepID=UPI0006F3ADEA|nr:bestrophin family ion channel [Chryseobacterium sp. Leaf180]KQR93415.1 hypothetical protein ASG01_09520 [Chryseobacterium sp. Leaf180]
MITTKYFNSKQILNLAGMHLIWLTAWSTLVAAVYQFTAWEWMTIPLVPLTLVGTSVSIFVGFKSNQAYDRLWEARKIWGAIVNSSRSFSVMVYNFGNSKHNTGDIVIRKKQLVYRHIAWLYTLKDQLLASTEWEHLSIERNFIGINVRRHRQIKAAFSDAVRTPLFQKKYLTDEEFENQDKYKNFATHLIAKQAKDLVDLRNESVFTDFEHMQLQNCQNDFYDFQGQAERIKKFPLPRQFANSGFIFIVIFIIMLPLGLVSEFSKLGDYGVWTCIPFCVVVGWIYVVMELVGDYSENPFSGLMFDIPMLSICRTIEIDLLQIIDEHNDLPDPVASKHGVLI